MLLKTSALKVRKPFSGLFPIEAGVLVAVKENMEAHGYDLGKPIDVWKKTVVDGHTRLQAARGAHIEEVPVFEHEFAGEAEALAYAIHNQRDRRNLTAGDITRCVAAVDKVKARGGDRKSEKAKSKTSQDVIDFESSAAETAAVVGVSPATVDRVRTILADPETAEEVLSGKTTSLKGAATKARAKAKEAKAASAAAKKPTKATFNRSNQTEKIIEVTTGIEWAKWSWNPVTGCKHGCTYCYARDIANRFYPHGFKPTFYPERLAAPQNTKVPQSEDPGEQNVFVCSMGDLFGEWVPQEWIDQVLKAVWEADQWNFLFLTKNPARMVGIEWPQNAWVGTTVDTQARVDPAIEAFQQIEAPIRFLSCEPLREELVFPTMECFDWVIVGGQSDSTGEPGGRQPEWEWVESLWMQVRAAGLKLYFKPNLTIRPREYPS